MLNRRQFLLGPIGLVTLPMKWCDGSELLKFLNSRDLLAPRGHRRGSESLMG
jgi:hypothetical protein